ncbi:hypothetical protein BD408DRAFT_423456 [Parasitella parasitica]|nr:hypothetical protein BD408DRAFT_423456 [Parasitella parasitica]
MCILEKSKISKLGGFPLGGIGADWVVPSLASFDQCECTFECILNKEKLLNN